MENRGDVQLVWAASERDLFAIDPFGTEEVLRRCRVKLSFKLGPGEMLGLPMN